MSKDPGTPETDEAAFREALADAKARLEANNIPRERWMFERDAKRLGMLDCGIRILPDPQPIPEGEE